MLYPVALLLLLSFSVTAETIQYEGSSTIGKFRSDAGKIYPHASFFINVNSESQGGELCAANKSCGLGGVARSVNSGVLEQGVKAI